MPPAIVIKISVYLQSVDHYSLAENKVFFYSQSTACRIRPSTAAFRRLSHTWPEGVLFYVYRAKTYAKRPLEF